MAMMEISVVPVGTGKPGVSEYVAKALKKVKESGLEYMLTPMGTLIVGEVEELLALASRIHNSVLKDCERVVTYIKLDDRKDKPLTFEGKIKSVEEKL